MPLNSIKRDNKVMQDFQSHCQFRVPSIDLGITAEKNFYYLSHLNNTEINDVHKCLLELPEKYKLTGTSPCRFGFSFDVFFDTKQLRIEIPFVNKINNCWNVIVLEFDFSFIISLNFDDISSNKKLTVTYHTPPKIMCGSLNTNGNIAECHRMIELPDGAPYDLIDHVVNGSAMDIFLVEDVSVLIAMLRRLRFSYTEMSIGRFPFASEWRNSKFVRPCYMLDAVRSLGYGAKYLLHREKNKLTQATDQEELLHDIYFHICKDPSLRDITIEKTAKLYAVSEDYINMKTAIITPYRIIYCPPAPTLSCYAFTNIDTEKLFEIRFRDENMKKIDSSFNAALDRIENLCRNGLSIDGIIYHDFLCSNSKFKEYGTYFYGTSKKKIRNIWRSFGTFERALPAKIGSRIGLNYTAVRKGVKINSHSVQEDIMSADGQYNFTDGCGQISLNVAKQLQKKLKIPFLPSAFQVRYPSFKGMLVVAPGNLPNDYDVIFRKSQKKYDPSIPSNATLDIVQYSSPAPLKLYKHLIELFCQVAEHNGEQYKEQVEKQIKHYFNQYKIGLIDQLVTGSNFKSALTHLPKYMSYDAMESYTPSELLSEYFLRGLVQVDALEKLRLLYMKQQIVFPEEYGRTMFGVPDFSGKLKENQVFVRYSEKINSKCKFHKILTGKVAVTKSPIYNKGDLRFVEAVDIPELHHLSDVIVFPVVGQRPLSDQIGGGDMDGDLYAVIWDPKLMMPSSCEASDYQSLQPDEAKKITIDQVQDCLFELRTEYMMREKVGQTANNHIILAEKYGFDHPITNGYAAMLDHHLNYHKSGILPEDIEKVYCGFNPDHMRREHQPMYRLDNCVGRIFRESETLYFHALEIVESDDSRPFKDPLIDIKGWEIHRERAQELLTSFKREMHAIMYCFGIKNEWELLSGRISEMPSCLNNYKNEVNSTNSAYSRVQELVNKVMQSYRTKILNEFTPKWEQEMERQEKEFFEFYSPEIPQEMKQFAVACYNVAYDEGTCFAFPWILWDVIDSVRLESKNMLSGFPFVAGVMEGANPQFFISPLNRFIEFNNNDNMFMDYAMGILLHMHSLANIHIDIELLKERLRSVANEYSMLGGNHIDDEEKLNRVLKFIKHIGVVHFEHYKDEFNCMAKIYRETYLRVAFKKNPEIFREGFYSSSESLQLKNIIIELTTLINEANLQSKLLERSHCRNIAIRFLPMPMQDKKRKYSILGYGTRDAISALKDMLIPDMTDVNDADPTRGHITKVRYLTDAVLRIMGLEWRSRSTGR